MDGGRPQASCRKCGDAFDVPKRGPRTEFCKRCRQANSKKTYRYRIAGKIDKPKRCPEPLETLEDSRRWWKYRMLPSTFRQMMEQQRNVCAVCEGPFSPIRGPHVDHDHSCCPGGTTCGECTRSLLCAGCNTGLGHYEARSFEFATYLLNYGKVGVVVMTEQHKQQAEYFESQRWNDYMDRSRLSRSPVDTYDPTFEMVWALEQVREATRG